MIVSEACIYIAWTNENFLCGRVALASRCGDPTLRVSLLFMYAKHGVTLLRGSPFSEGHVTSMEIGPYADVLNTPCSQPIRCKVKSNLFTYVAPRSSQELVQKCPCIPGSYWNLEKLVFEEREKPEYPVKNLSEQSREPTTNSTHIWRRVRKSNPGHIGWWHQIPLVDFLFPHGEWWVKEIGL